MKWDADLYDCKHGFVSKFGEDVIELLAPKIGEIILDVGCGTGDLTNLIHHKGAKVIGFDNSKEMIEAARKKFPQIQFDLKSAIDFNYDMEFDAVFSNAALHWVLEPAKAIKCIYDVLKPKGRFVAEFGGKGNVSNIICALTHTLQKKGYLETANKSVWYFPSLSEYSVLLEQNGFRVIFATHFDRETILKDHNGIKNWIQMFGTSYLQNIEEQVKESIVAEVEEKIRSTNFKNNGWYADYVRLRIVAVKL